MQARQRVTRTEEGEVRVEEYLKPRVTTSSSFGGPDGVNAGVPDAKRVVALPRVQALARATAIINTCGAEVLAGEEELRAVPWVADA
eukprot:875299-Pleurochrysis_carterae.AAC.1